MSSNPLQNATYLLLQNFDFEVNCVPWEWNQNDKFRFVDVNGCSVTYIGEGKSDAEASAVRANKGIPHQVAIYYYEVTIVDQGRDGYIGIGFSAASVPLSRLPGWEASSFGYHGDDGFIFHGSGTGKRYGPTYTAGDVIGCILNLKEKTISYTKNGIDLGVAFRNVTGYLFPSVGLRTPGEAVTANFGQEKFKFDIESVIFDEKMRVMREIMSMNDPDFYKSIHSTILDYVITQGYEETARNLAENGFDTRLLSSISKRKVASFGSDIPSKLSFLLQCGKFIYMVYNSEQSRIGGIPKSPRLGNQLSEILEYGKYLKSVHCEEHKSLLEDCFSLLAYSDPKNSPVSYLLEQKFLEEIADQVNLELYKYECGRDESILETLVKTTFATTKVLREYNPSACFIDPKRDFIK